MIIKGKNVSLLKANKNDKWQAHHLNSIDWVSFTFKKWDQLIYFALIFLINDFAEQVCKGIDKFVDINRFCR